jgi:hypothetical protein
MFMRGALKGRRVHAAVRRRVPVVHFSSSLKRVVLSHFLKSVAQLIDLLSASALPVRDVMLMTHRSREVVCGLIG